MVLRVLVEFRCSMTDLSRNNFRALNRVAESLTTIDGSGIAEVIMSRRPRCRWNAVWPSGTLKALRRWCDDHQAFLIFDEVMTGFRADGKIFACQGTTCTRILAVAKGLTGGYSLWRNSHDGSSLFRIPGPYEKTFFLRP